MTHYSARFLTPARSRAGFTGALALAVAACGGSTVEAPLDDVIAPEAIVTPTALPSVINGVRGDFALAYSGNQGGTEGWILVSGMVADEFETGDTFPTRIEMDQRRMRTQNASLTGVERNMHRARAAAERAADIIRQVTPTASTDIADMLNYAGLVDIAFAEGYCSGIPSSSLVDGVIVYGQPRTSAQIYGTVIARADSAAALAASVTGSAGVVAQATRAARGAAVLKGRALLGLGDYAGAAAAVAAVPTSFKDSIAHSELIARTFNGVFAFNDVLIRRWQVANGRTSIPGTVIAWQTVNDPRAPIAVTTRNTFDNRTRLFQQRKYANASASIPTLTGIEARLIEAEAAMIAGNGATYITRLNDLRATVPGLAPLVDPVTLTARTDLLFRERAFWLFATGHRLGDLRRLVRQYGRAQETVFPTGPHYRAPGDFGTDVNIPATLAEENNPNYTGCLNRDA